MFQVLKTVYRNAPSITQTCKNGKSNLPLLIGVKSCVVNYKGAGNRTADLAANPFFYISILNHTQIHTRQTSIWNATAYVFETTIC